MAEALRCFEIRKRRHIETYCIWDIKSSRSTNSSLLLEKLKIYITWQRKSLSQDTALQREAGTRNCSGSLWCSTTPSTNDAWHEMIVSVLRTAAQHQKREVMALQDFTSLAWKLSFLKLLYILESHYVKKKSVTSYSAETTVSLNS